MSEFLEKHSKLVNRWEDGKKYYRSCYQELFEDTYISDILTIWQSYKLIMFDKTAKKYEALGYARYEDVEIIKNTLKGLCESPLHLFYYTEKCQ